MNEHVHLFASVLLDPPGSGVARQLGKVQVSSLLRTLFPGEVVVWRSFPEPLYPVERKGVHEVDFVPSRPVTDEAGAERVVGEAKVQLARSLVEHASRYGWIVLADAGVLALRNWDHLFEGVGEEVLVTRKADGLIDKSFIAIKSAVYERFVIELESVGTFGRKGDELGTVIDGGGFRVREFERGEVIRAFEEGVGFREIMEAAVVILDGAKPLDKTKAAFALHMMKTFGDKDGLFLDLLES